MSALGEGTLAEVAAAARPPGEPPAAAAGEEAPGAVPQRVLPWTMVAVDALAIAGLAWFFARESLAPWHVVLFVVSYAIGMVGIEVGLHRYFAHRSFAAAAPVKVLLAILGCTALQGSVLVWATIHRKHHRHSDREGDPHSPVLRGLFHAHVAWHFRRSGRSISFLDFMRYSRDLLRDPLLIAVDRWAWGWFALGLALPALIGLLVTRTWQGALAGLLWGGLVRILVSHHATWCVNSICHAAFGPRPYGGHSANVWWVALLTHGSGWHNNHHAFPGSARGGHRPGELDVGYWVVRALERCGLAWDVQVPTAAQREAARSRAVEAARQ